MNEIIQIYRIIATIIVCFLHFQIAFSIQPIKGGQGYIMVDFFAILSGFLIAKHYYTSQKKNYLIKKFFSLYFVYVIPIIIMAVFNCIRNQQTMKGTIAYFISHTLEFFMANWVVPTNPNPIVPVLWYVPVLFFSAFISWNLLCSFNNSFKKIFSIIIALWIYNYFYITKGHMDVWSMSSGLYFNDGLLRVVAGTFLGIFCYFIVERLLLIPCNIILKKLIGLCSCLCQIIMFVLIIADKWNLGSDLLYIFLLSVNIIIGFWSELFIGNNKIIDLLAKISYPVYALHFVVYTIMQCLGFNADKPLLLGSIFIVSLLIGSLFLEKVSSMLIKCSMKALKIS